MILVKRFVGQDQKLLPTVVMSGLCQKADVSSRSKPARLGRLLHGACIDGLTS